MKKLALALTAILIVFSSSLLTCYASEYDDYLNEVNNKYGIELQKNDKAEEQVSFDEFKTKVDKMAFMHVKNEQKIILENDSSLSYNSLIPYAVTYKTKTAKKNADDNFYIKATYQYQTTAPYKVSNFSVISYGHRYMLSSYTFQKSNGYPTVQIIDGGRSGYIVYKGTLTDGTITDSNYRFSATFTYSS